jgi:hypothetical protein
MGLQSHAAFYRNLQSKKRITIGNQRNAVQLNPKGQWMHAIANITQKLPALARAGLAQLNSFFPGNPAAFGCHLFA